MPDRDENKGLDERGLSPALVAGLLLVVLAVVFVVQNSERVAIKFLFWEGEARVWVALLITSVIAVVATELLSRVIRRSRRN